MEATSIRGCADYPGLVPDYRAGRLSEARPGLKALMRPAIKLPPRCEGARYLIAQCLAELAGKPDRIQLASTGTSFGLDLDNLPWSVKKKL